MIYSFQAQNTDFGLNIDIDLTQNQSIYCFIGKNAVGKTKLLETMAQSLFYTHNIVWLPLFKTVAKHISNHVLNIAGTIHINKQLITNTNAKYRMSLDLYMLGDDGFSWLSPAAKLCNQPIVFIGAQNRGFTKNVNSQNIGILGNKESRFAESLNRTLAYINGEGLVSQEVANWFVLRLMLNTNFVAEVQNKLNEVYTVLKLVDTLMPELQLINQHTAKFNKAEDLTKNIKYDDGKLMFGHIPFDKLSTGVVAIIKIAQEIVAGYGEWTDINDLGQVEGIVFIDEIEQHLHISWQTKIMPILREVFPKTTFYISTHSPLVLSGLHTNEAYELYNENNTIQSKLIDNIENYYLNDLLGEFFDFDLNQHKLDNINMDRQKRAKELLKELAAKFDDESFS